MNVERLEEIYDARQEIHELAIRQVWESISVVLHTFSGEGELFPVPHKGDRIKPLSSLRKKAFDRQIIDEMRVFEEIKDIIGVRLITNNLKDIWELHDRIKSLTSLDYDPDSLQDYIKEPKDSGYRSLHFVVYCRVDHRGIRYRIPCEIQIRTLFQDAWAVLSQHDIYRNATDLPIIISKLSQRLADQLAVLDNIAQDNS